VTFGQNFWYGHFQRMYEERLPQLTLNWIPTGRRKNGDQKQDGMKAYIEPWKTVV
jgi:hypothetical protein